MAEVSFENATRRFPRSDRPAVSHLNLEVADKEFLVLVGPSGCGKTTSLRMVAGLEAVDEGTIRVDGEDVTDLPPRDRDIAMVFQNYALYPHMTVADNMGFSLKVSGIGKDERNRRITQAAALLDLVPYLGRKPSALSGGQRQRVAMGRAIVRQPQAFLMDEPLSNLDAQLRVQTRVEIHKLQRELGITTIYVTHDQTEAMTMGDRVAVMRDAELQQVDTPTALYDRPANRFVAGFLGSPAMNVLEARVSRIGEQLALDFGEHQLVVDEMVVRGRPALAAYTGRSVLIGIRPEDLHEASATGATTSSQRLTGICELSEELGSDLLVYFTLSVSNSAVSNHEQNGSTEPETRSGKAFVARLNPRTRVREGDRFDLVVDTGRLHFFDPETGVAIYGNREPAADGRTANTLANHSEPVANGALPSEG